MFHVQVHNTINLIISLFYRLGLWQKEAPLFRENRLEIFYSIYFLLFPVSLLAGSISSDNKDESIFLVESAAAASVLLLELLYIIWKKKPILKLLNRICVYSIEDHEEFTFVNDKLKLFMKCVFCLLVPVDLAAICIVFVFPFVGSEKKLFFPIGFPLDWKNDETAFWIAYAFLSTQMFLTTVIFLFSPVVWYLMINCGLKYRVLGNQIRKIGEIQLIKTMGKDRNNSTMKNSKIFLRDLIEVIQFHNRIRGEIQDMTSFLSPLFLTKLATSSICICVSVYSAVFSISGNLMESSIYLMAAFYYVFEIFMVMYFGEEIKSSSDCLTYCLFESSWVNQPQSTKKCLIIFGEMIKQPSLLVVGKLYPLTLDIFTRIMNSTYSMLNILRKIK